MENNCPTQNPFTPPPACPQTRRRLCHVSFVKGQLCCLIPQRTWQARLPSHSFPSAREGFGKGTRAMSQEKEQKPVRGGLGGGTRHIPPRYPGPRSLSPSSVCAWERGPDEAVLFPESKTPKRPWTGSTVFQSQARWQVGRRGDSGPGSSAPLPQPGASLTCCSCRRKR